MTIRIEINTESASEAARELKQLADSLALITLAQHQQRLPAPTTQPVQSGPIGSGGTDPRTETEQRADEEATASREKLKSEPAKEPDTKKAEKPKRGRKSKAEKEAEAARKAAEESAAKDVEKQSDPVEAQSADDASVKNDSGSSDENPDPYKLFDEDGKEEELFDKPEQYMTALISMFDDAPDAMTAKAVGKSNNETMKRLQDEEIDFSAVLQAYEKAIKPTADEDAAATEQAPAEDKPEVSDDAPEVQDPDVKTPKIEDVREAIQKVASAKGIKAAAALMAQFGGATKATEIKDEERAAFIKAADEAAE